MLLKDKQVAIVGGGPGGLTLARLLQQQGVQVKVYERDSDPFVRQQGATLDLHFESGLKALGEAGLMEEFEKNYRPGAERVTIVDNNALVHYTERDNDPIQDLNNRYARPEIDRGPLRDLLIESLNEDTVVWNSKFTALIRNGEGWDMVYENGTKAYADLVIGSDGANSKIRKYITGIERIYSGVTIVEGNVYNAAVNAPHLWELINGGKIFAHWNGKTIVLSAKGEGSLSFYTITEEADDWMRTSGIDFANQEQVYAWFKQRFSDWSEDWHEIFSSTESYFVGRPQYYFPVDQSWQSIPNLTMIGDAAHQTPPSGDGVNQAMLDALELYEVLCMDNFSSIHQAITAFEEKMRKRTAVATEEALQLVGAMCSENSLQFVLDFFDGLKTV
ncbi:FAD-dependent oxidoreductase [Dyadobacter psychrophilus]|uniref:2-polyprenyl-6-methoxyphenol hydroxylase n=1 Tax=Dyadobacter psychrophilus TaxID=651661 RepID=A0A1T5E1Y3_9BACT|nr:NAD(P)/FAD-dependent oxidoreductase [Dyadobacter psychrophilus]SKB77849.1 2-polyprenyl-6-methoxyphenol hydroxylase [Dyadobacter psychrophilus]